MVVRTRVGTRWAIAAIAVAGSVALAISSASAQTTYTWTQIASGNQDWTTAGNWSGSNQFVSGSGNQLMFFADTSTSIATTSLQTIVNVPATLSMNTLTLNGKGPNNASGFPINIGTTASTWTIGDGTTSTVNLNSTLGGGGNDRDVRYTIGANLTLVGNASGVTTFTGASTSGYGAIFSGNIGETVAGKGVTKSNSSLLVFSGNNSYTGTTSVTGGVLRLSSASALPGGTGTTGGTSPLTINGGVVELGATDFSRGLGTGSSQFQITGGSSGFSAYGGPRGVTVNGDASQELQWGSTFFQPSTLILNQLYSLQGTVYANGSIELRNKLDLNGATRTVQVNANAALLSNDIRNSTGIAGLTKSGAGTLVLTGNNTYNGDTTISSGTLSVSASSNFGSGLSGLVMGNSATLQIVGTTLTSTSGLGHTVTINSGNKGFDIQNAANTFTVDQVLNQGTGTLTKSGVGTLVLNQNNSFAGATTASGGGTLVLDYTTNNGSKLSDTAGLTLSGGALVLKGGSHTEAVASTTLTTYTSNSISRDGGSAKISLGAITLNLNSSLAISEANLATTTSVNTSGILTAGRVTVGSNFGANDGSNNIVAYSGYTAATTAGGGSSTVVYQLTGGGAMGASLSAYALRIVNGGNSDVLNLGSNSINLTNNTTLLYAGGSDNQYTINGTGAVTSASGNQPFVINTYAGTTLTVNARTSANFAPVSKAGAGTLVVGGNNSTMAAAFVQEGVLRVTHKDGLGNTTNGTTVQGGAALELSNNIAVGTEALSLNGAGISGSGALRNQSGTNSWAGAITIGVSGARINSDASTSLTLTGGIATTLTQDVTFGGAGNTTVSTAALGGSGSLVKDGNGMLTLAFANTYSGATTINAGTLLVSGSGSINTTSAINVAAGARFANNSSTPLALAPTLGGNGTGSRAVYGGTGTLNAALTLDNVGDVLSPGNSPGIMSFGVNQSWGSYSYDWELNDWAAKVAGTNIDQINITGGLTLTGATPGSYILNVLSLTGGDVSGAVPNFADVNNSWTILTTTGGISGFSADYWTINAAGFTSSPTATGSWSVAQSGNDLVLNYVAVPEPATIVLVASGAAILGSLLARRRRGS